MSENKNTGIIVVGAAGNSIMAITNDLFKDIDFTGISAAIDQIGAVDEVLEPEDKEMANEIVEQWKNDVISRLKKRGHEMDNFILFFKCGTNGNVMGAALMDEIGEELAKKTKTEKLFETLQKEMDALLDIYDTKPDEPIERLDRTRQEELEEFSQYKLDVAKYNLAIQRQQRSIYLAEKEWKKALLQNKEVIELLKQAKKFNKNLNSFTDSCHDKAQMAKLNITVSNKDIRAALKDLLTFTATV